MQTDLSFLYYRIWNFEYLSLFRCSLKVLVSLDLSRRYLIMKINIDFGYFLIISGFKLKFDMKNSQSNQKVPKKFPQCKMILLICFNIISKKFKRLWVYDVHRCMLNLKNSRGIKGGTKTYFAHYYCVAVVFLVFRLCAFCVYCIESNALNEDI